MSQPTVNSPQLSQAQRALLALKEMRAKLEKMQTEKSEPIAVVGIGCRFPKDADSPEDYWEMLKAGVSGIDEVPKDRWNLDEWYDPDPNAPGKMYTKWGGFYKSVDRFDPGFFGIPPREAENMDPQHLMLLEVMWEAFERAGIAPDSLSGSRTGVFLGVSNNDFTQIKTQFAQAADNNAFAATGTSFCMAAGRLSYTLGLQGPSMAVDTACSSSLVAIHLACQSLRSRDSHLALAAGVNLMLTPDPTVTFCKTGVLSKDGKCKTFDASADGYVRGEGCGVLVLKRLSDAQKDGDNIIALIRGSAVNQDGKSSGMTAPNGPAQEAVIKRALENAGVTPNEVGYVEAHGTGTEMGDPIEVHALSEVFGENRAQENPLRLGAVKTNLGSLEAASGMASIVKVAMMLKNKAFAPHLNLKEISPKLNLSEIPAEVPTTFTPWETVEKSRIAGVSSFGLSGTNAHIVLQEAEERTTKDGVFVNERPLHLLVLSAKGEFALREKAVQIQEALSLANSEDFADVCFIANGGRAHFAQRLAFIAASAEDARAQIGNFLNEKDNDAPGFINTVKATQRQKTAFVLCDLNESDVAASQVLFETQPAFKNAIQRCDELLKKSGESSFLENLYSLESASRSENQRRVACFVVQFALAEMWRAWGVKPGLFLANGVGELTAACLAGSVSLENALELAKNFDGVFEKIAWNRPRLPIIFLSHGDALKTEDLQRRGIWRGEAKDVSRLIKSVKLAKEKSCNIFLEIGFGRSLHDALLQMPETNGTLDQMLWLPGKTENGDDGAAWKSLLNSLAQMYLKGVEIDFKNFDAGYNRRRVVLPTYPFQRQQFKIEHGKASASPAPKKLRKLENIEDWFYAPSWKSLPQLPGAGLDARRETWLIFADEGGAGERLASKLAASDDKVISIKAGENFKREDWSYTINVKESTDYDIVLNELAVRGLAPTRVVHFWSLNETTEFETMQNQGLYGLVFLAQSLKRQNISTKITIDVITQKIFDIAGSEETFDANASTILAACKTLPQEFSNLRCRHIDLAEKPKTELADERLWQELSAEIDETTVALRGRRRWGQRFEKVKFDEVSEKLESAPSRSFPCRRESLEQSTALDSRLSGNDVELVFGDDSGGSRLRDGGVYLIIGGLGNLGLSIAHTLAGKAQAKLALLGRARFPEKSQWREYTKKHGKKDPVSKKIRVLHGLEQIGAEVLTLSADVANAEEMRGVFEKVEKTFGEINGVVHAAGQVGGGTFLPVQELNVDTFREQFQAKATGLEVLHELCAAKNPDFVLLTSSLSTILGGLGFTAYAAANQFMNAFAQQANLSSKFPWITVDWDNWIFEESEKSASGASNFSMSPEEGAKTLDFVFSKNAPTQMAVSTGDLEMRIDQWVRMKRADEAASSPSDKTLHQRPALSTEFVAPRDEFERAFAEILQDLLGIQEIGVNDNFFELGGTSMLGVEMFAKIEDKYGKRFSPALLFESPTIAQLAEALRKAVAGKGETYRALVPIQPSGSRPPFYLVHPQVGTVLGFADLARALGPDQPFFGLQARGLDGKQKPFNKIERMAGHYVKEILEHQPEGPYFIGGRCFGGIIALEMAQQLRKLGKKVGLLAILDTQAVPNVDLETENRDQLVKRTKQVHHQKNGKKELDLETDSHLVADLIGTSDPLLKAIMRKHQTARKKYRPKPWNGDLVLFRNGDESPIPEGQVIWEQLTLGKFEVHLVPGEHRTILLEPHVQTLAKKLRDSLDSAGAEVGKRATGGRFRAEKYEVV